MVFATPLSHRMQSANRRRKLYATDPIWRLTKLKDNWERRERKRRFP